MKLFITQLIFWIYLVYNRFRSAMCCSVFLQSTHTHLSGLQAIPIWKHSQYFFWQLDRLHLHPVMWTAFVDFWLFPFSFCWLCCLLIFNNLALNACGFRFLMLIRFSLINSLFSSTFIQLTQVHVWSQNLPAVKHSQYILRHLDLAHLQATVNEADFCRSSVSWGFMASSDFCFSRVFLPKPRRLLSDEFEEPLRSGPWEVSPLFDIFRIESGECRSCFMVNDSFESVLQFRDMFFISCLAYRLFLALLWGCLFGVSLSPEADLQIKE